MSTIVSPFRARYRAKLDRPIPESNPCANSSQVRRLIAKAMCSSGALPHGSEAIRRYGMIAIAAMLVAISGGLAMSLPSPVVGTSTKPKIVTTFIVEQPQPATTQREFVGTIQPTKRSELGFVRAGRVHRLNVQEGDHVKAGTIIAELDPSLAQSELAIAQTELRFAESRLKTLAISQPSVSTVRRSRSDSLSESTRGGQESYASAKALVEHWQAVKTQLELQLTQFQLRAPYDAIIAQTLLSEGSVVGPDRAIVKVVADSEPIVRVAMPLEHLRSLTSDRNYEFVNGSQRLAGTLKAILPESNQAEQAQDVLFALLEKPSATLGMQILLQLEVPSGETGFQVPKTCVQASPDGSNFIGIIRTEPRTTGSNQRPKSTAYKQAVEVLQATDKWLLVSGQLQPGDRIVAVLPKNFVDRQPVRFSDYLQWRQEMWLNAQ